MEQSWPRKNSEIQKEQDSMFIESANPIQLANIRELNRLITTQGDELNSESIEIPFHLEENLTPEQIAYNKELIGRLYKALLDPELLKDREKKLIQTIFFEGKNMEQVSSELKLKEGTIKSQISVALGKIRNSKYFIDLRPTSVDIGKLKV